MVSNGPEDFVHFANLLLILQEDGRVEIWNFLRRAFAYQLILARMSEEAEF